MKLTIYRYDPDKDAKPYYQDYDVPVDSHDRMLLDLVPVVVVEPGQVRRSGRAAAGLPLHRRHPRPGDQ